MEQISDAELVLLQALWAEGGSALSSAIMERLRKTGSGWHQNTVTTLLSRLMSKGIVCAKKDGRRNVYTALVSEGEFQTEQARDLVDRVYHGEAKDLVASLVDSDMLTDADRDELAKWWADRRSSK